MVGAEWIPECNLGKWSRIIRIAITLFKSHESFFVPVLTEGPSNHIIECFYKNLHKEIRQVLSWMMLCRMYFFSFKSFSPVWENTWQKQFKRGKICLAHNFTAYSALGFVDAGYTWHGRSKLQGCVLEASSLDGTLEIKGREDPKITCPWDPLPSADPTC